MRIEIQGRRDDQIARRPRPIVVVWLVFVLVLLLAAGCAKYNTFYNAQRSFDDAEHVREEAIRQHKDPPEPSGAQLTNYQEAIKKAQKVLDEYPGHSLTDDALFLQAKAHSRLSANRQSIKKLDLLFLNYPATEYQEEALYLQALNFLMIGALDRSQEYLDKLATQFPESDYQSETLIVSGDNAFTLEDWEAAAISYQRYLDENPDDEEVPRIGLKLAQCYWELEDYQKASEVLQDVGQTTISADLAFRSRVLRARVHSRLGDFEVADLLLVELEDEAPIYSAEGEVLLIEAENLVAQGRGEEAAPLIESMPEEWNTPVVKARAADILGYLYMKRGELEEAGDQFTIAVRGRDELDDYNRTRRLDENLTNYLSAETALPDARPERVPRLKLLQANAMLFGFDRPEEAGILFKEAGLDTAADSLLAPRGLFGAVVVYRDYLDQPDSVLRFESLLQQRYPESPQAYELRTGAEGDLLGYLLAQQDSAQSVYLAGLTPDELALLQETSLAGASSRLGPGRVMAGVRRRMVYLARRDNMLFDPPAGAAEAAQARLDAERQQRVQDEAEIEAMDLKLEADGVLKSDEGDSTLYSGDEFLTNPQAMDPALNDSTALQVPKPADPVPEEKEKEEEKEKKDGGFDLRSP